MFRYLIIIFILASFSVVIFTSSQQQLSFEEIISNAQGITAMRVRPLWGQEERYEVVSHEQELNADQCKSFVALLLDNKSFLIGIKKKCVFVPELLLKVKASNGELLILVSPSGKQLEFIQGDVKERREADPCFAQMDAIFKEITWEVIDEND